MNGATGKAIAFGRIDDAADLVETSYLLMGLLTAKAYSNGISLPERYFQKRVQQMWEAANWSWHTQGGQNKLYWHWSPNNGFQANFPIVGYNEALITYIMAAASPTHPIARVVYDSCWVGGRDWRNGKTYFGYRLPLDAYEQGGPLFFEQYTYMGINPNGLTDDHGIDYAEQTRNHTLINRAYCVANPKHW